MCFSGEDELDGTLRIIGHRSEFLQIRQNQIRSLIGGEAARKPDGEGIRTKNAANAFGWFSSVPGLFNCPSAHKVEQLGLQAEMCLPQFTVINLLDPFPDLRVTAVLVPAGPEVPVVKPEHLRRKPRRDVHS